MGLYILGASILFQLMAVVIASMIAWVTLRRSWILIAFAITLMALRRAISFYEVFILDRDVDAVAESVALLVSILMLAGFAGLFLLERSILSAKNDAMVNSVSALRSSSSNPGGIALFLGILIILTTAVVSYTSYTISRNALIESIFTSNLRTAQSYTSIADSPHLTLSLDERINLIGDLWDNETSSYKGSYICIIDSQGKLLIHSGNKSITGQYVGDVEIADKEKRYSKINDLLEAKADWVGWYKSGSGEQQVTGFSYSSELSALIAMHVPAREINSEISRGILPFLIGLIFILLVLLPAALGVLYRAYRMALQEVELSEQDLAITLNSIGDAVITTDTEGKITRMNPVAEKLTGRLQEDSLGQSLATVFPIVNAKSRETIENPIEKVLSTGENVYLSNDTTLIAKDGTEYQIADSAAPIRDEHGTIMGMVLVFNDISEKYRLRAEIDSQLSELREMTTARDLAEEEATRFGRLIEASLNEIYIFDAETFHFINVNFGARENLGYTMDELSQLTPYDLKPEYNLESFSEVIKPLRVGIGEDIEFTTIHMRKDGTEYPVEIHLQFMRGGQPAFVAFVRDITERVEHEEALLRKEEQLRLSQKMDALGQLTGGIAHDYNNMLAVIIGYSDLLELRLEDHPKLLEYSHEISHAAKRATKLTEKLLSFSRTKIAEAENIDINALLHYQRGMLEKALTVRVKLHFDLEDSLWPVWLDNGDLESAIINLSINAMHSIEGNGQLTIRTSNMLVSKADIQMLDLDPGDYVLLSFTDTGCGMDQQTKERVFEPFFSTKGKQGTGLGLSQVYGFVERSGGTIKIYSELDHGTQVMLYFPRNIDHVSTDDEQAADTYLANFGGNETILIVDDELALLQINELILREQGYHVISTDHAKNVLEILEGESVDLLLSDVIMPDIDGYQLAASVQEKYPDIKIQLISGFSDVGHADGVDETLSANLLQKPCRSNTLLKRIRELLDS